MAKFIRNITNALRPFKRIRREIGAIRSELNAIHADIIAHNAYEAMRDLNLVDKNLLVFYYRIGDKINICNDFTTMQRYLNAVRPVRSNFIVQNLVRVGGANDGGYIMVNPKIDLLSGNSSNLYLGASFADLANFGRSQTESLVSRPKFAKNHKTSTANTSIVCNAESVKSAEFNEKNSKITESSAKSADSAILHSAPPLIDKNPR